MLLDDFYKITDLKSRESFVGAEIQLNPEHRLYKGHFPQQAVVPGVMQIQIIRELMEVALEKPLMIKEVTVAKYLRLVTPHENQKLQVQVDYRFKETGEYLVNAVITNGETTFSRVKTKLSLSTM
jgi:3-hydroxyacyl-[acyl-carrier-protein] dehydratase